MKIIDETLKPRCVGGFGEINYGKQYRDGNRVYDSRCVAVAVKASPVGNLGGYTNLYLVYESSKL